MQKILRKINVVAALVSAIRLFVRRNRDRSLRQKVFALLHPTASSGPLHRYIDSLIILCVLVSVVSIVLETVPEMHALFAAQFHALELFTVTVFTLEYLGRVYGCCELPRYADPVRGRLRYMVSIPALIDLVAILPFFIGLLIGHLFDLRFFRVFRLSRLLKLSRYTGTLNTLFKAVQREQRVLFASAFMMVLLVILTASLGYELEHAAQPDKFESIPASMYWAVITLASVGYGDISPVTPLGRAMTAVISLLGIGIFAIPAGLMASAFTDQLRIDRETFENEFREALAKGAISLADQHALSAEAERLHLSKQDVDRIMYKVKQELRQHGGEGLNAETMAQLGPDQLLERYRQQVSQLRALALGENALRLQSALADVDNTTRSERQVWQALRGEAAD